MSTESAEQQGVSNSSSHDSTPTPTPTPTLIDAALGMTEMEKEKSMPVRQYLECTVLPLLLKALQKLVLERPSDPVQFLVSFLSENNPRSTILKRDEADATSCSG